MRPTSSLGHPIAYKRREKTPWLPTWQQVMLQLYKLFFTVTILFLISSCVCLNDTIGYFAGASADIAGSTCLALHTPTTIEERCPFAYLASSSQAGTLSSQFYTEKVHKSIFKTQSILQLRKITTHARKMWKTPISNAKVTNTKKLLLSHNTCLFTKFCDSI